MSKEKGKYDGLLCFLLALIVVLILVIGGGAYYFLVLDNGEEIADNAENTTTETNKLSQTELNEIKNYMIQNDMEYFLVETYEDVREARLDEGVLYPFITQNGDSQEGEYDSYKIAKSKVEEFIKKNTGYSLEDFENGKELGKRQYGRIRYNNEDDTYYMSTAGALDLISGELVSAEKDGNKYILNYEKTVLTLNKVDNRYLVVSHNKKNVTEVYAGLILYVKEDCTIAYYNKEQKEYNYVIDEKGNKVIAKQVFTQRGTQANGLNSQGITSRMLIITEDNQLLYVDDIDKNKNFVAKSLNKETVVKVEISKVKLQNYNERIDLIVHTKGGGQIQKKDISYSYYFDSTKQIEF